MCSTGCPTQDHRSWGECVRAKALQIGPADEKPRREWDRELTSYAEARRQGIQPAGTQQHQIDGAVQFADRHGFDAVTGR